MIESASITKRWTKLRRIPAQLAYVNSTHRFNVLPCGRRSGKTELAKRKLVYRALLPPGFVGASDYDDPKYFCAAPTRDQAKRIYWDDIQKLIPKQLIADISISELTIFTKLGSSITVLGMDKPERIEGSPWDGGILDEYGNMKGQAWGANVRPALADRRGWCDLIGVPEGRNHYYETATMAKAMMIARGEDSEWGYFHWVSSLILPPEEIAAARENLDELTFKQEYEGDFINFTGRAYYSFDDENKACVEYIPGLPVDVSFDFNVEPGVAVLSQEGPLPNGERGTRVFREVYIPQNSNTVLVSNKVVSILREIGHLGDVFVYGDATGGNRGTAKVAGSDWDLVKEVFRQLGDRVYYRVKRSNPPERARLNAVNSRCRSATGVRRLVIDPVNCPNLVRDFEGVRLVAGGSGEIDKNADKKLTHISDAIGYRIYYSFSGGNELSAVTALYG